MVNNTNEQAAEWSILPWWFELAETPHDRVLKHQRHAPPVASAD